MVTNHTLADRLRARATQLGIAPAQVAEQASVNRSFVYDILNGRSTRPGTEKLDRVAEVLKVDREWLSSGLGGVEGEAPDIENLDDVFVPILHAANARPSMGGGTIAEDATDGSERLYNFRRSWIRNNLKASPSQLRTMHVRGDSMAPTLSDGDTVLVDMLQCSPIPAGIFVLDDGMGLVAKRLEHIPNSDPPAVRVISDNKHYPEYERSAEEIHIVGRIRWFAREI